MRRSAIDPELGERVRRPRRLPEDGPGPGLVGGADAAGEDQDGGPDVLDRRAQLFGQFPGPRFADRLGLVLVH
ncbi:hypothetical protein ACFRMQ_21335 [Kitasatospora sp. NPDC056783]|uniref:hypothetical protein n=1 Tax=Kitasatospora sp. NPDC056783 TaxID=3345943 RepID=UPI0036BB924D